MKFIDTQTNLKISIIVQVIVFLMPSPLVRNTTSDFHWLKTDR